MSATVGIDERLWTISHVAEHLGVSVKAARRMAIPCVTLPSSGKRPIVRYDPIQVRAWWDSYRTRKLVRAG